jgi:predicted nucleotidyltransferase
LKKIILFGSYARGDHFPNSDIDLLLVSDEFHDDWFKRHARLYYLKVRRIEPFGYTSHELQQLIEVGNPFIEIILKEGKELPLEDILGTNL